MEYLPNGMTIELPAGTSPLSTDSVVLAHAVRLPRNACVLDLGSGCGTLGLLLCDRDPGCHITGLELSEASHAAARENIRRNRLEARMTSIHGDLRELTPDLWDHFQVCVSNPPYFSGGPASITNPMARRDDCCTPEDLMRAAARALKFGGDFYLVHKPEKLAQLISRAADCGLEAKELTLLRHKSDGPISLILLKFRKGAKSGLVLHEHCLFDSRGEATGYYREVYHIKGD